MRKIIFLVFLSLSTSAFAFEIGFKGPCSEIDINFSGYCKIISVRDFTPVSAIAEPNDFIHDYYYWIYDLEPSDCDDGSLSFFSHRKSDSRTYFLHQQCEIDTDPSSRFYLYGCDPADDPLLGSCHCPNFSTKTDGYYELCTVSRFSIEISQKTASKTNDLISESNSKLGSVASSNSTNTDLLNKIKNSLTALLSKNSAVFGVDSNASNEPIPLTSEISLSSISPLMSTSGSCPSGISISVMNSTHHLSYQPLCDFANKLHPLVIAAARVSAAWLVIGAL